VASSQSQYAYDDRNRYAPISRQNCSSELAASVAGGSPFQARAAATGSAQSPRVERLVGGTCKHHGVGGTQTTAYLDIGSELEAVRWVGRRCAVHIAVSQNTSV